MTLANGHFVVVTGKDEPRLLLSLMSVLVKQIPQAHADEASVMAPNSQAAPVDEQILETTMKSTATTQEADERAAARLQVGLTTKVSLHQLVKEVADRRAVSVSTAARDLFKDGLVRFDEESRTVSPSKLLSEYEFKANHYDGIESENWIIRADRRLVMRARLRAGEYGRSLSSFANFILANALSHCPHAAAVRADSSGSIITDEAVAEAVRAIEQSSGVKARVLAPQIDLGEQRGLTNMILGGTVLAPARVLAKLAAALKLPLDVLSVALERRFATQPVPAFKATDGKPTVQIERKAWSVAVRELQLPTDEQERLLKLEG
ncbi:hypothetical protein [Halopseudomonas pelagia]|uniref:Uncharacterized protein n=1 Tax=Halopseudomonas pelagia TaxID=553151 RepID=A0AA91Z3X2_9GAMM|nr:hypothetical protein [Halopseudomonas pelagia]PCC97322.1 hypothetical protein CO192_21365 [Halopseudomonas pelagia]QFY58520.1 hypothetical protein EAO82_20475 [Halopseudomonas pelagia]